MSNDASWTLTRGSAVAGLFGVLANIAAVAALRNTPHAYKPHVLDIWLVELRADPQGSQASAILFTLGVLAFIPFALAFSLRAWRAGSGLAVLGGLSIALGSLMNAAATMTPFVVAQNLGQLPDSKATSIALLGFTLAMDSLFNALLSIGLIAIGLGFLKISRGLALWALFAGLLTIPVAGQLFYEGCASWLVVAGPVWLSWFIAASVHLWSWPAAEERERFYS